METRQLYLHLLNLTRVDGTPATDREMLHRDIAKTPECLAAHLDARTLADFSSGIRILSESQVEIVREALDRAQRNMIDPMFHWRPRWLNSPQDPRHAHPSITEAAAHPPAS